ncbi:tRNA (guanosine(37)-N1)-methyltransferase TrmD [Rubrivirga sp. SAORIC476]|uniref:tRNA (guanosine(37)-N1)-methyltransferase TrmD n=1 Tax=Rubrivirga sp. SAORIC476 TaxID=1961794 RepID=UPI0018E90DDE|nr:tRNA (guanosine(37)-N1)-methyltransferase TrmD [Rubrivirga sp. SAORIC476]
MIRFDLVTALPDLVRSPLEHSILKRAQDKGLVEVAVHDLRDWAPGKHRQIDDIPYGGMGGMVLKPEPLFACVEALTEAHGPYDEVIFLTPDGETLDQPMANQLSLTGRLLLIAGHYKNIDQRVRDVLVTREISVGDFVLSGGELPALILIDAIARLVPGVLGDAGSALSDSFQDGLLDAPSYTRPASFRGLDVPDVLRSGDHGAILAWREEQRLDRTRTRRPDLLPDADAAGEESP